MIRESATATIDVPLEHVWDWIKDLENIASKIPRVEILEKIDDNKLKVRGNVLPIFNLPEDLSGGIAETVEVDENKYHTITITEGEIFTLWTRLECEGLEDGRTKIYMEAEAELAGLSGSILEKIVYNRLVKLFLPSTRIQEILDGLTENIKDYMRMHWRKELEKKTKELKTFVYTVSHDLRTPLVSLEGFAELLEDEYGDELGEEGKHYLERISANVDKIDSFLNDLLQLSRIGRKEPPKELVDLEDVVNEVGEDLRTDLEEKGISLEVGGELPSFYFERKRIYQVFSNFISNACKYIGTPENPKIEIDGEDKGDSWLVWVEDNGIGIEDDQQENIFEVFQRENRVDEEGTGVGLAITKRIVEEHDGEVWVESEVGEGSTFYMEFPKHAVEKPEEEEEE